MTRWLGQWWRWVTGTVVSPYAAMEDVSECARIAPGALVFAAALAVWATLFAIIGTPAISLMKSALAACAMYPLSPLAIFAVARLLKGEGRLRQYVAAWGFSYLPTIGAMAAIWVAHRAGGLLGSSGLYATQWILIMALIFMFLWKLLLLATLLRVVANLNFKRIFAGTAVCLVLACAYWAVGVYFGIFRVPFI